jgi:SAM-dependent methyltransferase
MIEWIERLRLRSDEGSSARHDHSAADRRERKRALDVAMGRGRHALALARAGFRTFGVDARLDALRDAAAAAAADGLQLRLWCADLTDYPLPPSRFDLVLVSRYLQRDLFPSLQAATMRRGVVLYETFTTAQRALGTGPRSPEHLLEDGELRARFEIAGWDVLYYEETRAPEAVARLAARRSA